MSDSNGADFDLFDDHYVYSPPGTHRRHRGTIRASDADREAAAAELRRHYATGRLDTDELGERLSAAYSARTHGSLDKLFVDLPVGPTAAPVQATPQRIELQPHRRHRSSLWPVCLMALVLFSMLGGLRSTGLGIILLVFVAFWCVLLCALIHMVRSGTRFFYEAGRRWGRHNSRW